MPASLILHHYDASPFAEKVRLMLGFKRLAWAGVQIPAMLPKPDVVALTGGYRKTPVLQVGADIYCDTALIARVLEAQQPTPTLYPPTLPLAEALAQWADSQLFQLAVAWAMQPAGIQAILGNPSPETLKAFAADRAAMRGAQIRPTLADATPQLRRHLAAFQRQLQQGGPWLLGAEPCIADFSVGHCLWFIRSAGPMAALLDDYPAVAAWLTRLMAIGHGSPSVLGSETAITLAREEGGHAPVAVQPGLGFEAGEAVVVMATDTGCDPVAGTLVGLSAEQATIERVDPRAGTVHVHVPRAGFQIRRDGR